MSDELDELEEFNSRVGGSNRGGGGGSGLATAAPSNREEEDVESPQKAKDASMWAVQGVSYFPCDESVEKLGPGQYEVCHSGTSGYYFKRCEAHFDELMRLPDSASEEMCQNIETFWTKEKHFRSFGFLWKRGILLWGPAGSGKTSTLQLISQDIVNKGGISVYVSNPSVTAHGLAIFRRIEPIRPCVVMLEDLDAMISNHGEHEVLALLDGELQIDNVVFIATTNYPERLDKRIVNRPSRFDIVKLIGMPNPAAREMYLSRKNKRLIEATLMCTSCRGAGSNEGTETCTACMGSKEIVSQVNCESCKGQKSVEIEQVCPACPEQTEEDTPCTNCNASGHVKVQIPCSKCEASGLTALSKPCAACNAVGQVGVDRSCSACGGKGNVSELARWVKDSDQFSIAHLKELIVSVEVFEVPLEHAVKRLQKMMNMTPKSTDAEVMASPGQYT